MAEKLNSADHNERPEDLSESREHSTIRKSQIHQNAKYSPEISKQLMYPEKFTSCYKEGKLKIVGNESQEAPRTFYMPQNSVLSRIKGFLPQLSEANKSTASEIASNEGQQELLTIEPVGLCSDESDEDEDSEETKNCTEKPHSSAPFVEMNVSLVPSEVLSKFDDSEDEDSDNSSTSDENVEDALSVLQHNLSPNPQGTVCTGEQPVAKHSAAKSVVIEELSNSTVTEKDVAPSR
ncbi:hypothetical protein PoB_004979900 [Plakobranchus ocellatus]|uniref:Uncharacterized protein n=1 Tax=Plakobranchus ocellatus TaxID=259542 RepID=A0AAV4BY18_9GAST|nr:hypothetical protein PoB_004979900 [Plakobranchus ocellatus]